jgi:hypothetical protein
MATPPVVLKPQWIVKQAGAGGGSGKLHRTLLVKDAIVGNDIADRVTAYGSGVATRIVGVLRKAISAPLTVRVNKNGTAFVTITIPSATAISVPVTQTTFAGSAAVSDGDVFSWDITASDGSKDVAGIASFTLDWS